MDFLRFAINHVALPPRLPQEQESDFDSLEAKLTGQVTEVIEEYRQHLGPNHQDFWMKMKEMMSLWVAMQQNFDEKKLEQVLMSIKCRGEYTAYIQIPWPTQARFRGITFVFTKRGNAGAQRR